MEECSYKENNGIRRRGLLVFYTSLYHRFVIIFILMEPLKSMSSVNEPTNKNITCGVQRHVNKIRNLKT